MAQSQISRALRDGAAVGRIASILSREEFGSRRALGRRICAEFSFFDAAGRPQLAGCMKALASLAERRPEIVLPPPAAPAADSRPAAARGGRSGAGRGSGASRRGSGISRSPPPPRPRTGPFGTR